MDHTAAELARRRMRLANGDAKRIRVTAPADCNIRWVENELPSHRVAVTPCYNRSMSSIVRRRARVRGDRHQVTLPAEVREALQVRSGDEIEFAVDEHGTVTVRG